MSKAVIIETEELGVLSGRDCIYLDKVEYNSNGNLLLIGEINGDLVSKNTLNKEWYKYSMMFSRVLAYFACELETHDMIAGIEHLDTSCFHIVENSNWIDTLPIRKDFNKLDYNHYRVYTYDIVYNIIAVSYKLDISDFYLSKERAY